VLDQNDKTLEREKRLGKFVSICCTYDLARTQLQEAMASLNNSYGLQVD
jgi:hypothetical protein